MDGSNLDNFDLRRLSGAQRRALCVRYQVVREMSQAWCEAYERKMPWMQALEQLRQSLASRGIVVCRQTLYGWQRAWRADGIRGLVDRRWLRGQPKPRASKFLALVKHLYLEPDMRSPAECHLLAKKEAENRGWEVCTLRESRRFIKEHVLPLITRERSFPNPTPDGDGNNSEPGNAAGAA